MNEQSPIAVTQLIQSRYGSFHILAGEDLISDSLRQYGEWAQQELDILLAFIEPGQTVVDAGAYIGTHTRAFSNRVGPTGNVFSFEPNPSSFAVLQANVAAAPIANIHPLNLGLGAREEKLSITLDNNLHNLASASMTQGYEQEIATARIQAMDAIDIPCVHLLKVDVEGMELALLEGAQHIIDRDHPSIFLEVNSLEGSHEFLSWSTDHDYVAYGINVGAFNPDNYLQANANIFGSACEVGLLLIHEQAISRHALALARLNLPLIDSLDALALLLLHKPQYLEETLAATDACKQLGLSIASSERQQLQELETLLRAKDLALENAAQAYVALQAAFEMKESELRRVLSAIQEATEQGISAQPPQTGV